MDTREIMLHPFVIGVHLVCIASKMFAIRNVHSFIMLMMMSELVLLQMAIHLILLFMSKILALFASPSIFFWVLLVVMFP